MENFEIIEEKDLKAFNEKAPYFLFGAGGIFGAFKLSVYTCNYDDIQSRYKATKLLSETNFKNDFIAWLEKRIINSNQEMVNKEKERDELRKSIIATSNMLELSKEKDHFFEIFKEIIK